MKKLAVIGLLALTMALLLVGCEGSTFSFTGSGTKVNIEVNNAPDGATGESYNFSVGIGNGRVAVIDSSLDKGQLQIDFTEVTIFRQEDRPDDVYVGDVVESATVGAGEQKSVPLAPGDYIMQVTAIGETNGKIAVSIEKP